MVTSLICGLKIVFASFCIFTHRLYRCVFWQRKPRQKLFIGPQKKGQLHPHNSWNLCQVPSRAPPEAINSQDDWGPLPIPLGACLGVAEGQLPGPTHCLGYHRRWAGCFFPLYQHFKAHPCSVFAIFAQTFRGFVQNFSQAFFARNDRDAFRACQNLYS